MAHQFVLGRADEGQRITIGHEHCPKCGRCLLNGVTQVNHDCPQPVRKDILEVMLDEMRSTDEKTRIMNRVPEGFQEVSRGRWR